jgi:hypothetical protein
MRIRAFTVALLFVLTANLAHADALLVLRAFEQYRPGQTITDEPTIQSILNGPYAGYVIHVNPGNGSGPQPPPTTAPTITATYQGLPTSLLLGGGLSTDGTSLNTAFPATGGTLTGLLTMNGGAVVSGGLTADFLTAASGSTQLLFKESAYGNILLELGGSLNDIEPKTNITLPFGTVTWGSGAALNNVAPIYQIVNYAGTTTNPASALGIYLNQSDASSITTGSAGISDVTNLATGEVGERESAQFILNVNGTSNTTPQGYTAVNMKCNLFATDPPGTALPANGSTCFGENPVAYAGPGVIAYAIVGSEINTWLDPTATVAARLGLQIVDTLGGAGTYGGQATQDDIMLSFNNGYAPTSTMGYKVGIEFGRYLGAFPIATTGTLIYGQGFQGAAWTVANGIDWHIGTFTGNSWNDGHVSFSGAGDVLLNSASALATNATAGFVHLPHTTAAPTGTPANTTPGCEWNTATHVLNCYDGSAWYHFTGAAGAG